MIHKVFIGVVDNEGQCSRIETTLSFLGENSNIAALSQEHLQVARPPETRQRAPLLGLAQGVGPGLPMPGMNTSCRSMSVTPQAMLIETLLCCITLLTVLLNLLVIISISHFRQLHTPTNVILLSLAVSDLIVGLEMMPTSIREWQSCWFMGKITCVFIYLIGFTINSASVGNMVLISVDRYVAICDPLRYSSMVTLSRVKVGVSLCWFCSVVYNVILLKDFFSQIDFSISCLQQCVVFISYISGAVDMVLTFFCPVTVIIVLYTRVFVVAVSQARVMRSQISTVKSNTVTVKKSEMRAARTLGITLFVFVLCLCPYYIPSLAGQDIIGGGASVQNWLFYCNSTFNPLIYAFFYPWFRKAVKVIVSLQILQPGSCNAKIM
ncbi:trace amine-associated receptor 1-like [Centropristis striata]|uniref:trace amine-associated receptor 1-like n=1 Tax=Centropristis striata TaxID=184440 RepID=UPI0027DFAAE6|nr:trace amine-associated receptor 1-like [Centropristis striata]